MGHRGGRHYGSNEKRKNNFVKLHKPEFFQLTWGKNADLK
jgi:hypothetical protein